MKLRQTLSSLFVIGSFTAALATGCGSEGDGDGETGAGGEGGQGGSRATEDDGTPASFCTSDKDCRDSDMVCDSARSACVECLAQSDCGKNALCNNGACEEYTPCDSTKDCDVTQVCADSLGYCVDCEGDNDCADDQACVENSCFDRCTSDKDCRESDGVCSTENSVCVDCQADTDCAQDEYCASGGSCEPTLCEAGESYCDGDALTTCNDRGISFSQITCSSGCSNGACDKEACTEGESGCDCYGNDSCNEGLECDSGTCVDPIVGGGCAGNTGNVCSRIPYFSGTQSIDADPADFCEVPATVFTFASAEFTNVTATRTTDTSNSVATVRAAWDSTAFRAHIHVKDPNIAHTGSYSYNGDNVQFFIGRQAPDTGDMDDDYAAQITLVPYDDVSDKRTAALEGYGSSANLDWASRYVADGYEIEIEWSWPAGVAPVSGSDIAFNVQVGVEDDGPGRDFEYALSFKEGGSCYAATRATEELVYCDTNYWCSPEALSE